MPADDDGGREWLRTTLYSIGDAVITTDAHGHVREMNPVAETLTGWREAEAAGRPFAEIFVALNEDTRERVADPVSLILRDGIVVGLANHTVLVSRDGAERPVADSGAPIRRSDGALIGTVVVFRDQTEERHYLHALEQSEHRHRELFEANPHAMWVYDEDALSFLEVNAAATARYGYTRDEFLAMTLADIRPPEDVAALRADVAGVPDGFEGGRRWRHLKRDRSQIAVEISSHPVPWPGKRARVVLAHDVTAQAALEARLRWQAEMLTRLASHEPLPVLLDELTRYVCSLCPGVMSTIMLVEGTSGVLRPAASHNVPAVIQSAADPTPMREGVGVCGTAAARRAPFVVEDIATHPAFAAYAAVTGPHNLQAAWSHPFYDSKGQLLGTAAMYASDPGPPTAHESAIATFAATLAGVMVERARVIDALHEREARLQAIFDTEPECVMVLDRNGRLVDINPAGLRLIEAESLEDVQGTDVADLATAEFRERFDGLTRDVVKGGEGRLEFELVGLKGTRRLLDTHVAPLRDARGRVAAVLGITRDITERKALTAQLMQAQRLESVGQLAGGVAHDFNNMLGVIQGQTELALQDLPPDSAAARGLHEVLKAAQRSAALTRQLLAFARREPSSPRVIDLNARIDELIGMLSRLIGEGVALVWTGGRDLWPVRFDPAQLDQVLTNLVVNARDAMQGTGTLTVATANVTVTKGENPPPGDYVRLEVTDSGAGMDSATLARIFEPFFTTKPQGQGTGLGLATVYGIVHQHGGVVSVDSKPGRGATFRIMLPREAGAVQGAADRPASRAAASGRETILVVEDEPALLTMITDVLRRHGYQTLAAQNAQEAEGLVRAHVGPLHLLLTDLVMPGLSGRELWRRVHAQRPDLRCVMMSGYTNEDKRVEAAGVPVLNKPFPMRELVETVRAALDADRPDA